MHKYLRRLGSNSGNPVLVLVATLLAGLGLLTLILLEALA